MEIPFTLKDWLKDKSQKVYLKHAGKPVEILKYDIPGVRPILLYCSLGVLRIGNEAAPQYRILSGTAEGACYQPNSISPAYDHLIIVTPDEVPLEFEKLVDSYIWDKPSRESGEPKKEYSERCARDLYIAAKKIIETQI